MARLAKRSALTFRPRGEGPARQAGWLTHRLAAGSLLAAGLLCVGLWLFTGWEAGEALALFACLTVAGAMAFHIADHVADFLGR